MKRFRLALVLAFTSALAVTSATDAQSTKKAIVMVLGETPGMKEPQSDVAAIVRSYGTTRDIIILSPKHANPAVIKVALAIVQKRNEPNFKGPENILIRKGTVPTAVKGAAKEAEYLAALRRQPLRNLSGFGMTQYLTIE